MQKISIRVPLILLLIVSGMMLLSSCGKKWKEPVSTSFSFSMKETAGNPQLIFYQASLLLEKLEIEGSRKQGEEHIFLEKTNATGIYTFSPASPSSTISMDIPQGTYSEITARVFLQTDTEGSYHIEAVFINAAGDSIPMIYKYDPETVLEVRSSSSGQSAINLIEDNSYRAKIYLNMNYLFDAVPNQSLEDAELSTVNSVPAIEIDEDNNSDIYNILAGRINQCLELTIEQ